MRKPGGVSLAFSPWVFLRVQKCLAIWKNMDDEHPREVRSDKKPSGYIKPKFRPAVCKMGNAFVEVVWESKAKTRFEVEMVSEAFTKKNDHPFSNCLGFLVPGSNHLERVAPKRICSIRRCLKFYESNIDCTCGKDVFTLQPDVFLPTAPSPAQNMTPLTQLLQKRHQIH